MNKITNIQAAKEFVRAKADLLHIIQEDIGNKEWKQEGTNTWSTLSPFREETKASFKVNGNKWKDWGGEQYSGDIFSWLQIYHGLKFDEAIICAADRCGIDITQFLRDPTPEELQLNRFKQINAIAAEYMQELLKNNVIVRDNYLSRSGFSWSMIEPYQVGYCPNTDTIISYVANKMRMTEDEIHRLEFSRSDLFTDSIIYPIHNHSGEVTTFRTKKLNQQDAQYIGMRKEHPLYDQSILYGFHIAKRNFRHNGSKLVIVEGQRDAIALGAAAAMTSALNSKQVELLKQYKIKELVVCFDGDVTGWNKTLELVNNPQDFGDILLLVARPEIDKDPHDVWREGGDEAVYKMLSSAVLPIEYYIQSTYGKPGTLNITEKYKLLNNLKDYLIQINGLHLDITSAYLAQLMDSTKDSIVDYVSELKAGYSQTFNIEAERTLIAACMKSSISYTTAIAAGISKEAFTLSNYQKLFSACKLAYEKYYENYTAQAVLDEAMAKFAIKDLPDAVSIILESNYKYKEAAACEIVLDMWKRRTVSIQANELITASRDLSTSFVQIVNKHRKTLIDTVSGSRPQARTPSELANEAYNVIKKREQEGGNLIIGYSFHALNSINMILGGIQPGHMMVVAGSTGAGKSLLAMNILKCLAIDCKVPTLWIGQEMQSDENTMRLYSIVSGINNTKLQSGSLTQKQAIELDKTRRIIEDSCYYMAKPVDGTIDEIVAIVDEYRFKYGIKVVIWDYLQLIQSATWQSRLPREQVIGHASKVVKNRFTTDMGLAAVVVAQMNRSFDKQKGTERVGGSYQISQDADDFIEIMEKTKLQMAEDGAHNGNRYVKVIKRRGGVSNFMVNVDLDVDPRSLSLRMSECMQPSEISQLYTRLTS